MSEELERKHLHQTNKAQGVDTGYAEMALGKPFGSLVDNSEQIAGMIKGAKDFPALFRVLDSIEGIQGSKQFFTSDNLQIKILYYVRTGEHGEVITNGSGLFDKIEGLTAEAKARFEKFHKSIQTLDPSLSLTHFRQHLATQILQRKSPAEKERIGIAMQGAAIGSVESPSVGSFSSTEEFKEEVRKLLKTRK